MNGNPLCWASNDVAQQLVNNPIPVPVTSAPQRVLTCYTTPHHTQRMCPFLPD